jgi:hypothetical protein
MFIGLFDKTGQHVGHIRFFDVRQAPKKNGAPADAELKDWNWMLDQIHLEFSRRSAGFRWADEKELLTPEEAEALSSETGDEEE